MIRLRTLWRLIRLSQWTPPPGVQRSLAVHDDGAIDVLLGYEIYGDVHTVMPGHAVGSDTFGAIRQKTFRLLEAAAVARRQKWEAEHRNSTPEDRVSQALDLYGLAFEAKLASSANSYRKGN